jgi:hypothetical protein
MKNIINTAKIIFFMFAFLMSDAGVYAAEKKVGKTAAYDEIAGVWRGKVQYLHHNTRYKDPSFYSLSWTVISIDKLGKIIGRGENECAFEGTIAPWQQLVPAKMEVIVYRCEDPEMNRKFTGYLNKRGEFTMTWTMQDDIYPIVIRITGMMVRGDK